MARLDKQDIPLTGSRSLSCPSRKMNFQSRKDAKAFANRTARSGGDRLRPYQCRQCGMWHLGHLPRAVVRGEVSEETWYQGKQARAEWQRERSARRQENVRLVRDEVDGSGRQGGEDDLDDVERRALQDTGSDDLTEHTDGSGDELTNAG